ncbi:unnamed protein product [Didymodactylos carnosus]|uniref:Uncharacterized protein n=2 Tax=Didymodactylos carnosus TaxID=1234261 RepID=A0A814Z6S9_9BILA|nr:unnamed protein product [Didymodactylos carnosus]CAF4004074.1 unnamed protein product [Didymodactylos carnosus]
MDNLINNYHLPLRLHLVDGNDQKYFSIHIRPHIHLEQIQSVDLGYLSKSFNLNLFSNLKSLKCYVGDSDDVKQLIVPNQQLEYISMVLSEEQSDQNNFSRILEIIFSRCSKLKTFVFMLYAPFGNETIWYDHLSQLTTRTTSLQNLIIHGYDFEFKSLLSLLDFVPHIRYLQGVSCHRDVYVASPVINDTDVPQSPSSLVYSNLLILKLALSLTKFSRLEKFLKLFPNLQQLHLFGLLFVNDINYLDAVQWHRLLSSLLHLLRLEINLMVYLHDEVDNNSSIRELKQIFDRNSYLQERNIYLECNDNNGNDRRIMGDYRK